MNLTLKGELAAEGEFVEQRILTVETLAQDKFIKAAGQKIRAARLEAELRALAEALDRAVYVDRTDFH